MDDANSARSERAGVYPGRAALVLDPGAAPLLAEAA